MAGRMRPFYWTIKTLTQFALRLLFRARYRSQSNLPADGAVILAVNHQSFLDPTLVGCAARRPVHFMARDTLFEHRVLGWLIGRLNTFPVKRGRGDVAAFKMSLRILKGGGALVMFPEATRSETGRIRALRPGVIKLARRTNATIVPIAVEGTFDAWPRDAKRPRCRPVWLEFGTAIPPESWADRNDEDAAQMLTAKLRDLHNNLRRFAGRTPFDYADEADGDGAEVTASDL